MLATNRESTFAVLVTLTHSSCIRIPRIYGFVTPPRIRGCDSSVVHHVLEFTAALGEYSIGFGFFDEKIRQYLSFDCVRGLYEMYIFPSITRSTLLASTDKPISASQLRIGCGPLAPRTLIYQSLVGAPHSLAKRHLCIAIDTFDVLKVLSVFHVIHGHLDLVRPLYRPCGNGEALEGVIRIRLQLSESISEPSCALELARVFLPLLGVSLSDFQLGSSGDQIVGHQSCVLVSHSKILRFLSRAQSLEAMSYSMSADGSSINCTCGDVVTRGIYLEAGAVGTHSIGSMPFAIDTHISVPHALPSGVRIGGGLGSFHLLLRVSPLGSFHGRDISSSSSSRYLFLDFHVRVSAPRCPEESSEERAYSSSARVLRLPRSPELGGLSLGERLCHKPAVTTRLAQPITDCDAPVIVCAMSVQVLQVSRLSTRNFLSDSTEYWRSTGDQSPRSLRYEITSCRQFRPHPYNHAVDLPCFVIVAVVWVVPRGGPIAVKTRSYGAFGAPEAELKICLVAWSLCSSPVGVRWWAHLMIMTPVRNGVLDTLRTVALVGPWMPVCDVARPIHLGPSLLQGGRFPLFELAGSLAEGTSYASSTVFSTWTTFRGNTPDLSSFGEETDEITDLHQDSPRSIILRAWRWRRMHKVTPS
ncbi:hypothetical protein Tco_0017443 [Tanacetum coccineum]